MAKISRYREQGGSLMIARKLVAVSGLMSFSLLALGLGGCSSGMSRYAQDEPSTYYLDGNAPSVQRTGSVRRTARRAPASAEQARAEDVSSSTTGTRGTPREQGALKPYSQEWWDNENREDTRLKQKMNICRGC
jgi:hypothetical protein